MKRMNQQQQRLLYGGKIGYPKYSFDLGWKVRNLFYKKTFMQLLIRFKHKGGETDETNITFN